MLQRWELFHSHWFPNITHCCALADWKNDNSSMAATLFGNLTYYKYVLLILYCAQCLLSRLRKTVAPVVNKPWIRQGSLQQRHIQSTSPYKASFSVDTYSYALYESNILDPTACSLAVCSDRIKMKCWHKYRHKPWSSSIIVQNTCVNLITLCQTNEWLIQYVGHKW